MAQVKLLKIASDGVPLEFSSTDDITLNSFTAGAGPVMSPTGIDMNGQDVTDLSDLVFTDPSVGTINQTAGALIVNNIMAKERSNSMAAGSDILFGSVGDVAAELDAFKIPNATALPTATPAASATQGYLVAYNGSLWMWDGTAWNDLGVADTVNQVSNSYIADEALSARDVLYISAANNVSKALANNTSQSYAMGLAKAAAADTAAVDVISEGVMSGFTGLTAGSRYYLDDTTAGAITATAPTASGKTIVQVGYAKSTTALHIHIEQMGRRA